jgi:hypothetical protein
MSDDGPRPKAFDHNYDRYKKSKREEDRVADKLDGNRLPRSGGLAWSAHDKTTDGGDLKGKHLLVEHKRVEPDVKSIGIKREWLAKVTKGAARRIGKTPALVVSFERPRGHVQDWLMLPLDVAKRLMDVQLEDDDGEG